MRLGLPSEVVGLARFSGQGDFPRRPSGLLLRAACFVSFAVAFALGSSEASSLFLPPSSSRSSAAATPSSSRPPLLGGDAPPYSSRDMALVCRHFLANFQPNGAVAASPSRADPDYWYHWSRDGALSMLQLSAILDDDDHHAPCSGAGLDRRAMRALLTTYAEQWVPAAQFAADPNQGVPVQGEPKWYLDGRVFDRPWMRTQNDGPALRALALISYANKLIREGDAARATVGGLYLQGHLPYRSALVVAASSTSFHLLCHAQGSTRA